MTWSMRRPPAVARRGPDRLDERLVAGRAQLPRDERRQAPVLAGGVELVGRRADAAARAPAGPASPGVGAVGVEADGEVGRPADAAAAGRGRAARSSCHWQPGVEADATALGSRRSAATAGDAGWR